MEVWGWGKEEPESWPSPPHLTPPQCPEIGRERCVDLWWISFRVLDIEHWLTEKDLRSLVSPLILWFKESLQASISHKGKVASFVSALTIGNIFQLLVSESYSELTIHPKSPPRLLSYGYTT